MPGSNGLLIVLIIPEVNLIVFSIKNLERHGGIFPTVLMKFCLGWSSSSVVDVGRDSWGIMMTSSNGNISALLAICAKNSPVPAEFPAQRPVMRSFDVFFDLCLIKRLSKQSWGWWFETLSCPLWRHRNDTFGPRVIRPFSRKLKYIRFHFHYQPGHLFTKGRESV